MRFDLLAFYAGPDQVMTVTSGIASIVGFFLIFWNRVVNAFFKLVGRTRQPANPTAQQDTTKPSS